jgi:hypothetical protein
LEWGSASLIADLTEEEKKKMGRPMFGDKPLKPRTFKISDEDDEKLAQAAKQQKKTKSQILRDLISGL